MTVGTSMHHQGAHQSSEILSTMCSLAGRILAFGITHASTTKPLLIWQPWNVPRNPLYCKLLATSAPSSASAYSVLVVGALGGVIISQRAIGGGGISETPTEACSLRFSTTGLRKASGLSGFSLFTRRTPSFGNTQWNRALHTVYEPPRGVIFHS